MKPCCKIAFADEDKRDGVCFSKDGFCQLCSRVPGGVAVRLGVFVFTPFTLKRMHTVPPHVSRSPGLYMVCVVVCDSIQK